MKSINFKQLIPVLVLTLLVFIPSFNNEITNWDDEKYINLNGYIQDINGENIQSIFKSFYLGNYHPFTMLSYAVDYSIAGNSPWIYHLSNLLFHLLNTALIYLLVLRLTTLEKFKLYDNKKHVVALVASLLFGVHTLHVESVSWISERKDVMYTFFFLLASVKYIDYLNLNKNKLLIYTILLFACALLSKAMAASFAVTLLLFDYAAGRKLFSRKVILEKVPFFVLALIFGLVAIKAQQTDNAIGDIDKYPFYERILFAGYGFVQYILKSFVPANLSSLYEYPLKENGALPVKYYIIPLLSIPLGWFIYKKRNYKPLIFGVLFFLINVFLVLQLLPVGNAIMADRYYYVPSAGLFILAGMFYTDYSLKYKWLKYTGIAFIVMLSIMSVKRQDVWQNSITLWTDVIDKNTNVPLAYNNRGIIKSDAGDLKGALNDFDNAITLNPDYIFALNNRADVKQDMGDLKGAYQDLTKAIELDPEYATAYNTRGNVLKKAGKHKEAIMDYNNAIEFDPAYANAYYNRGNTKSEMDDFSCIDDYNKAIELNPQFSDAYVARGLVYKKMKNFDKALQDMNFAERLTPSFMVYVNRGNIRNDMEDYDAARLDFAKAIQLQPTSSSAYQNYGVTCYYQKDYKTAIQYMQKAVQYNANNSVAYYVMGLCQIQSGDRNVGCQSLNSALNLGFAAAANDINTYCR